ncbi:MAG TPA: protein translocase subunit SecF [Spirochaetota bacterium]|nr:protein translocase subunit SecF [Spirochaetota bacterium]
MDKYLKFIQYRFIGYVVTVVLFIVFITGTVMNGGFNWGIDFVGGIKIIAKFDQSVTAPKIREVLRAGNINADVQKYGGDEVNEYVISTRLPERAAYANVYEGAQERAAEMAAAATGSTLAVTNTGAERIQALLKNNFTNVQIVGIDEVGPAIGDYLKKSAIYLFFWCVALMMVYLAFRFEFRFSVGALAAIVHDVALTFLFCGMFSIEINIPIIAGILTIFGYSVNDTIVVYDRIRENLTNMAKQSFMEIINRSVTQTLSRTILTTITSLIAVFCLYMIGEDVINDFALILLFGFSVGVFSTIFVASPLVYEWNRIKGK